MTDAVAALAAAALRYERALARIEQLTLKLDAAAAEAQAAWVEREAAHRAVLDEAETAAQVTLAREQMLARGVTPISTRRRA